MQVKLMHAFGGGRFWIKTAPHVGRVFRFSTGFGFFVFGFSVPARDSAESPSTGVVSNTNTWKKKKTHSNADEKNNHPYVAQTGIISSSSSGHQVSMLASSARGLFPNSRHGGLAAVVVLFPPRTSQSRWHCTTGCKLSWSAFLCRAFLATQLRFPLFACHDSSSCASCIFTKFTILLCSSLPSVVYLGSSPWWFFASFTLQWLFSHGRATLRIADLVPVASLLPFVVRFLSGVVSWVCAGVSFVCMDLLALCAVSQAGLQTDFPRKLLARLTGWTLDSGLLRHNNNRPTNDFKSHGERMLKSSVFR